MSSNDSASSSQDNSPLSEITSPADPGATLTPSSPAAHYARAMRFFRAEGSVANNVRHECTHLGVSGLALAAVGSGYYPIRASAAWPGMRIPKAETAGG